MDGFKLFYLLNEIHAHVLSQQPKYVVGYRANVWAFDDNFLPRMANIPKIIQAQHPQRLPPPDNMTSVPTLLRWMKNVGDSVIGTIKNGKLVATFADHPITPTSPLLPKIQKVLAQHGVNVQPETAQAPGVAQQNMGTPPKIAYHGTNTHHIGNILRNGLQPAVAQANWGVQHNDKTFLTTDFYTAQLHAQNSLKKHGGEGQPVVVAFKITDPARLGSDFDVDKASTPTKERPSQFEAAIEPKYSTSPMQASNHAGLFSFRGTLTPQMIHSVYTTEPGSYSKFRQMTPDEIQHFKKFQSVRQDPDFSKNYPKPRNAAPAAAQQKPHDPEDWSLDLGDEDFGANLMMGDQQPQYPQAIPVQPQQPQPPQPPQGQQQKPWYKRWFGG